MIRFSVIIIWVFFGIQTATANSDQETLLNTYDEFQAAMVSKDYKQARNLAKEAWETSEALYGDTQQTGDFAFNYASIGEKLDGTKKNKDVEKAFKRSIELAGFHTEQPNVTSLLRLQRYHGYLVTRKKSKLAEEVFETASVLATDEGLSNTKTFAKLQKSQAEYHYNKRDYEDVKIKAIIVLQPFETLGLSQSEEAYDTRFTLAKSLTHLGEYQEAISNLQTIWTNTEDVLQPTDPLVGLAYVWASRSITAYYENNDLDWDADYTFSDCGGCWPNIDPKYLKNVRETQNYTVIRHPPAYAERANSSGFVALLFDTDDDGKATNIRIIDRSHRGIFDKSSMDSVKKWEVKLKDTGAPARNLKGLVAPMKFALIDHKGRYIDFYGKSSKD